MKVSVVSCILVFLATQSALPATTQIVVHADAPVPALESKMPSLEQLAKMPVVALKIRDFKLLSGGTGWVSTGNQLLLTTDGGAHWKDISPRTPDLASPNADKFSGVFFLNQNKGWLLYETEVKDDDPELGSDRPSPDYDTFLSSTEDGGATWTTVSEIPSSHLGVEVFGGGRVVFSDALHGWVELGVMRSGVLFSTSDGGRTWRLCKGGSGIGAEVVATGTKDIWLAGGRDYELFVSHDGGETVEKVHLTPPSGVGDGYYPTYGAPVFEGGLNGYEEVVYTGSGQDKSVAVLFATEDGGRTWKVDRVLANLAPGTAGDQQFSTVVGPYWINSLTMDASQHKLMKILPGTATTDATGASLGRCEVSFVDLYRGWRDCSGDVDSTNDGGVTWTDITPRVPPQSRKLVPAAYGNSGSPRALFGSLRNCATFPIGISPKLPSLSRWLSPVTTYSQFAAVAHSRMRLSVGFSFALSTASLGRWPRLV